MPRPLVANRARRETYDVYVGRPSRWGNPFQEGVDGTRREVIVKYACWLLEQPDLVSALSNLKDKVLGCWCAPRECHANVLVSAAQTHVMNVAWGNRLTGSSDVLACLGGWVLRAQDAGFWSISNEKSRQFHSARTVNSHLAQYEAVSAWVSLAVFPEVY